MRYINAVLFIGVRYLEDKLPFLVAYGLYTFFQKRDSGIAQRLSGGGIPHCSPQDVDRAVLAGAGQYKGEDNY
jgi:hypothetical protein